MASVSVYSTAASDAVIYSRNGTSFAATRDATNGTSMGRTTRSSAFGVRASRLPGRGGGYLWYVNRSFFYFAVSELDADYSDYTATLNIYGVTFSTASLFAVKSNYSAEVTTADFDAIVGWDGSGLVDNTDNVTKYSEKVTSWSTSGYNSIPLNAQLLTDIGNDDEVKIALIESEYDLKGVDPEGAGVYSGMYYSDYPGTSLDPYIELTEPITGNSIFFGANF